MASLRADGLSFAWEGRVLGSRWPLLTMVEQHQLLGVSGDGLGRARLLEFNFCWLWSPGPGIPGGQWCLDLGMDFGCCCHWPTGGHTLELVLSEPLLGDSVPPRQGSTTYQSKDAYCF